jgi:hypothetical protein
VFVKQEVGKLKLDPKNIQTFRRERFKAKLGFGLKLTHSYWPGSCSSFWPEFIVKWYFGPQKIIFCLGLVYEEFQPIDLSSP